MAKNTNKNTTGKKDTRNAMLLTMKEVHEKSNANDDNQTLKDEYRKKHQLLLMMEIIAVASILGLAAFFAAKQSTDMRGRADTKALETTVSIVPATSNAQTGNTTKFTLVISNAEFSAGYIKISLKYDPSHIQIKQILPGDDTNTLFPLEPPNIEVANQAGNLLLVYGAETDAGQSIQALKAAVIEANVLKNAISEITVIADKSQIVFVNQNQAVILPQVGIIDSNPIIPTSTPTPSAIEETDRPIIMENETTPVIETNPNMESTDLLTE